MRLLHVSDLHLGRALGDLSREPEQRDLVGELIAAADELEVALTLISGDVFDGWSPPAWAEDLFFELLDGLAAGGQRAVAVIAGNHDSGLRLAAADPLARRLGIVLAGNVGEPCKGFDGGGDRVQTGPRSGPIRGAVAQTRTRGASRSGEPMKVRPRGKISTTSRGRRGILRRCGRDARTQPAPMGPTRGFSRLRGPRALRSAGSTAPGLTRAFHPPDLRT